MTRQLIDPHELEQMLNALYQVGKQPEGGVYRPLYSDAWREGRDLVIRWMEERGINVREDVVGNLVGRVEGTAGGKAIATGSHIDTVRNGGRLDGALGVVGGLLAVAALKENYGTPNQPLEVIITCEEEGSRFTNNFWGALSIIGEATIEQANQSVDEEGITLEDAMRAAGYEPTQLKLAQRDDLDTFLELHVEQGATLEKNSETIGVVTAITGIKHVHVRVKGRADHAGTTPMAYRADALAGAAAMISAIEEAAQMFGPPAVATVGKIQVHPSQVNVTPDDVLFTIDMRHADAETLDELHRQIAQRIHSIAQERGLTVEIRLIDEHPPVPMAAAIIASVEAATNAQSLPYRLMPSGAGHDAQIFARRCRAGMIFVPSIGGRSHTPDEQTVLADLVAGVNVLAGALHRLAY